MRTHKFISSLVASIVAATLVVVLVPGLSLPTGAVNVSPTGEAPPTITTHPSYPTTSSDPSSTPSSSDPTSASSTPSATCDPTVNSGTSGSGTQSCCMTTDSKGNQVATDCAATSGNCQQLSKCDLISKYINPAITFLSVLVGLVAVGSIIMGAIQYSSSAGNPQAAQAARSRIQNALLAIVAYAFLVAILNFIVPGGLL